MAVESLLSASVSFLFPFILIGHSPEIPRVRAEYFSGCPEMRKNSEICRDLMYASCGITSPPATPCDKAVIEIVENVSPKGTIDSGVTKITLENKVEKQEPLERSFDTMCLLSGRIRDAK